MRVTITICLNIESSLEPYLSYFITKKINIWSLWFNCTLSSESFSFWKNYLCPLHHPTHTHRERERERERYLLTHFTLVKNSVQITAIGDLLTIHRCYDVTQNESTIGITFGWLQALQHEDWSTLIEWKKKTIKPKEANVNKRRKIKTKHLT